MNLVKNEKDRIEFFRQINRALRPLRKALMRFKKSISKVDWEKINEELKKRGQDD